MLNKQTTDTRDLSEFSKEELLAVIQNLQQENAHLSQVAHETQSSPGKMSFRQKYAEKILDALPDMLTVIKDDGTTLAIVSSEDTNHSGFSRDDIYGVNARDFLPDHVYGHVMECIDQAKKYGTSKNLNHLMYVEGKPHYFENRTVRIEDDCNLCLCRDITDEILTKFQLNSLSYAVNLVDENIFSLNAKGDFVFANKQFLDEHNIKSIEGISAIGVMLSCHTAQQWEEIKEKIYQNQGSTNYIHEHHNADGTKTAYDISAHLMRNINNDEEFWFFARNITLRLEQERKISDLNALMKAILNNIPTYLFVKDSSDMKYLYWNKALEERTGILAEQAIRHTDTEIFPLQSDGEKFINDDLELIKGKKRIEFVEDFVNTSGEKRIVKTIKVPIEREGNTPLIVGVSLDITDMKMTEKELIAAKKQAEQSNQLKSAFLANMSHEIRTPLNAIVGFARLIMTEEDVEARHEYSDIIDRNAELLLQLINDILDLSKIEAGTLDFVIEKINLDELCRDMLEIHSMKAPSNVEIIYEKTSDDLIVDSDWKRLAQVFTNLLSNALKFTPSGKIKFGYSVVGDNVEAFVRDSGMGISADQLPTIFDRFIKLNNFVPGTGLGLSITRTIVERLGGTISVSSEEGKGSEFRFSIPYKNCSSTTSSSTNEQQLANKPHAKTAYTACKKSSIMIAEDDDSCFMLIDKFLGEKYTIFRALNGIKAVEMFNDHSPDLVIMDIKMPEMDGLEATQIIRALSPDVPIIMLSAFAYDTDRENAANAGSNHFFSKPFDLDQLETLLAQYLD